jgi:O-antigen/teichoic acid export membrane protein
MTMPVLEPMEQQPAVAVDERRRERSKRVWLSVLSSLLTRPVSVIVAVLSVPLFLEYLGAERFGLYESITALVAWLGLTNIGLGLGLVNKLTDCHVSENRTLARGYVSSLLVAITVLVVGTALVYSIVVALVNWGAVFKTSDPSVAGEIPWTVWVTGILLLLSFYSSVPPAIYSAYQELHRNNFWDASAKLASLAGAALVAWFTDWGLVGMAVAFAGGPVLVRLLNLVTMMTIEKPWLRPSPRLFEWPLLRATAGDGIYLFVLQMAGILIFQTDKLVIGTAIDPTSVAGYAVLGKFFLLGYGVFQMLQIPLWPACGEALRRGDTPWVKKHLALSLLTGCGMMLACGAALLIFGEPILRVWTRGEVPPVSRNLILAVTAMFVSRAFLDSFSVVLIAANRLLGQVIFFGSHAVLNVIVAILVAKPFGVEGVAWAAALTGLLTSVWAYPWMAWRHVLRPGAPAVSA